MSIGRRWRRWCAWAIAACLLVVFLAQPGGAEPRNAVAHPRTPYRLAFYRRHNPSYRVAGALHFAHGKLHDVLLLSPFAQHKAADDAFYQEILEFYNDPPRIEPSQELYAPYTARATWRLFRVIDWTHLLHEMTEDIMSDASIPWDQKGEMLRGAYDYYRSRPNSSLSPAPLDVTMRRAGVMMKPYFSLTRNYYPKSNNFFYAAHWWHPALYESFMLGGNGPGQDKTMAEMERVFREDVVPNPPLRMILSRELMPRYSRLSPETANVFDNLHMLHGITYDIFAYDGWSIDQKRAELYRVIEAMSYHPGDEKLVRNFDLPKPDVNPLNYDEWSRSPQGSMSRIMQEMLDEMMPVMMPDDHDAHGASSTPMHGEHGAHGKPTGHAMPPPAQPMPMGDAPRPMEHRGMMAQLRHHLTQKLTPDRQPGEVPGSFMDAMMQVMPNMTMAPEAMAPGQINPKMIDAMLAGWQAKYGNRPDVPPMPMDPEPDGSAVLPS